MASDTRTATPPQGNTGKPAGNAPTAADVKATATETAAARQAAGAAEVKAGKAQETTAGRPPVGLGPVVTHDVIGRKLPKGGTPEGDQARRLQQREATIERQRRVEEDVDRVNHGLPPKWADTKAED